MKLYLTCLFLCIVFCIAGIAGIVRVPEDRPTIQAGIDAAVDGDTVLVAESTYFENINFKGKAIMVASYYVMDEDTNYINNTIIDGSQHSHPDSGSVVYFISGEDTNSVLTGFTITGGSGTIGQFPGFQPTRDGGGVYEWYAGAKIENNRIIDNHITTTGNTPASSAGILAIGDVGDYHVIRDNEIRQNSVTAADSWVNGAVGLWSKETCLFEGNQLRNNVCYAPNGSAVGGGLIIDGSQDHPGPYIICNNIISDNELHSASSGGAGIGIWQASPILTNNIISGNLAIGGSRGGGGIYTNTSEPMLINNTITNNNTSGYGGGIRVYGSQTNVTVMNSILWGNSAVSGSGQQVSYAGAYVIVRFSDIEGGYDGTGNIDLNPQFENQLGNTSPCLLASASPCIDAGDPDPAYNDPEDPANPGFALWPAKGELRNDMGAYGGPGSTVLEPIVGIEASPLPAEGVPRNFQLFQNYPNPFNPTTTIEFALPIAGFVSLKIYDVTGAAIATLVSEQLPAGSYQYQWDARGLASGVYIYRMEAANFTQSRKMLLIR